MMICALSATGFRLPAWLLRERNTLTSTEQNAPPLTGSEELKESEEEENASAGRDSWRARD